MIIGLIAGTSQRVMPWTISSQSAHVAERSGARQVQRLGGDERIIRPRVPNRSMSGRYSLSYAVTYRNAHKEARDNITGHSVFNNVCADQSNGHVPRVNENCSCKTRLYDFKLLRASFPIEEKK